MGDDGRQDTGISAFDACTPPVVFASGACGSVNLPGVIVNLHGAAVVAAGAFATSSSGGPLIAGALGPRVPSDGSRLERGEVKRHGLCPCGGAIVPIARKRMREQAGLALAAEKVHRKAGIPTTAQPCPRPERGADQDRRKL